MKAMAMLANQFFFFLVDPFCSIFMRCLCDIHMYTFIYLGGSLAVAFALALITWYSIIVKFCSILDVQVHDAQVTLALLAPIPSTSTYRTHHMSRFAIMLNVCWGPGIMRIYIKCVNRIDTHIRNHAVESVRMHTCLHVLVTCCLYPVESDRHHSCDKRQQ